MIVLHDRWSRGQEARDAIMTVAMEHQAARTVSAREIGCFLLLFVVLLGPALINAFPLVMEDSIAYSGQGAQWMRG
jgi:hypothetical protein